MAAPRGSGVGRAVNFPDLERLIQETSLEPLPEEALSQFQAYLDLLQRWNSRLNLTSIRDRESILRRHFLECIQCAQALPSLNAGPATLLDFGSGAGLPGIPIAICRPELRVTLAESQRKKAAFLREAIRCLGLNAEVFDGRVESMAAERTFRFVTLRAVDNMNQACASGLARVAPNGWIIAFTTEALEPNLKSAVPNVVWQPDLRTYGTDQGIVLIGQRTA